ncbi:hypothetical protein E1A91_A01G135800v1 [Gossypium mustelinum]|uniref:Uncharacterized protein n=1 Tax=Gossypium mustelinum TaxID=34275 RepID=A0A5D3AF06_GOSMU|nr:hypothetical protein E1A91_A01G135800v1 [Gossypium mustelinum]
MEVARSKKDLVVSQKKYVINLLKRGWDEWLFPTDTPIDLNVKFRNKEGRLVDKGQYQRLVDWLVGSSLPSDFNPTTIQKILNELSPESVRIFWESKKFEGLTDKVEPWYGTAYSIEKASPSTIQAWMSSAPNENLHLPAPNVFIPTNLSIKNAQEKIKLPVLLRNVLYSKGIFKINFDCPHASNSPETEVLTDLFTRFLMDYLNEYGMINADDFSLVFYSYYARVAGLRYHVTGYNHKLRILLETIIDKIAKFEVKPDRFSVIKVHRDDFKLNVKLQLVALIAEQAAFRQLRSVEQLGYITLLRLRNDSGIHGLQFIIQSIVKDPGHIDTRVEAFLKMFESKLYEMTKDDFKSNVNALINMKLEKHKNSSEESQFYWTEIISGRTPKFDRREAEVDALKKLTQQELIYFFDENIKVGATRKITLSVRVYGNQHLAEYNSQKSEAVQPNTVQIDDIFSFRRSRPLYASVR